RGGAAARPSGGRRSRNAAPSRPPRLRSLVRCAGAGDRRPAPGDPRDVGAGAVIILGLTGSIGMGKSTAAATLRRLGIPLFDADRLVHRLLAPGGSAVEPVAAAFPGVRRVEGGIDRALLGQRVFSDRETLLRLERIIHPMVEAGEKRFLDSARARREPIVVL